MTARRHSQTFCEKYGLKMPILLAPMDGVADANLVRALGHPKIGSAASCVGGELAKVKPRDLGPELEWIAASNVDVDTGYEPARHFRDTLNSYLGSAFSVEPILTQSAWFRPHNRSEDIENLYFAGAGTHPGAGLPGVLSSGKIVAEMIGAGEPAGEIAKV